MRAALFLLLLLSASVNAQWLDCPFGEVNDTYPGKCARYVDTDSDGICDHSQPAPQERATVAVNPPVSGQPTEGDYQPPQILEETPTQPSTRGRVYNMIPVAAALTVLYVASWYNQKKGNISLLTHRRIWNVLLLFSFLVSALLGVWLVIRINYGVQYSPPFNALYWHVEAGVVMAVISLFHISWHIPYYRCIVSKPKNKKCE